MKCRKPTRESAALKRTAGAHSGDAAERKGQKWEFRLYVADQTPKSKQAFANLKQICEEHLPAKYRIQVIDLLEKPHLAQRDQILALPTLVRIMPEPVRTVIGDLSNLERAVARLDLQPRRLREAM